MRILVTGASGFVGGRLMELASDRHEVFGVGRRKLDRDDYASVDLGRTPVDRLPELPWTPDAVVHCAARATPYASRRDYERDNIAGTRTVVEWCERLGRDGSRPRLVHVSSSSVLYRDGDQLGLTEESPVGPEFANDYARTKAASEEVAAAYDGPVVIARPRAVFGPGDTVLFPRIIAAAKADRLPLLTGRGTPAVGDLIYVDNLAEYLLDLAVRRELTGVYHLTNAEPVEMQALLVEVLDRLGFPPPRREVSIGTALRAAFVLERTWRLLHLPGEPPITRYGVGVLSWSKTFVPDKMLNDLGPPGISIEKGVAEFVEWQKARL
jgi:nucleoside-diphosphate-sugar epimerase